MSYRETRAAERRDALDLAMLASKLDLKLFKVTRYVAYTAHGARAEGKGHRVLSRTTFGDGRRLNNRSVARDAQTYTCDLIKARAA